MDISEYTRIVFERIHKIEPEHVTKIIGYILLHDQGNQKIVRLAEASDHELHKIVSKATADLQLQSLATKPCTMMSPHLLTQAIGFHGAERILYDENLKWTAGYLNSAKGRLDSPITVQEPIMNASYFTSHCYHEDKPADIQYSRGRREFPVKTCHYFNKGFCKHGMNCRYYHGQVNVESWYQLYGNGDGNDGVNDGHIFSLGSLSQLEAELVELLRPRNGDPLSITSLPMVYYERYKKELRAYGYFNENQRYGKTVYSLTKLLARLKNSIRIIDRPHGHAVILAEYAAKYFKYKSHEKVDTSQNASASRQIYLTFPADSTFTEEDVSDYFNTFGRVEDVRIPCQQKRMFGFVTFVNTDTVKAILEKGNPHNVGGSRVLVKPYREKSKLSDRKFRERIEQSIQYSPEYIDLHRKLAPMPRQDDTPTLFLRTDRMNDQEQSLEFEMRQLALLQLTQKAPSSSSRFGYSQDGLRSFHEEHLSSGVDDQQRDEDLNNTDLDSQVLNLPDSPFSMSTIAYSHMAEDYRY